MVVLNNFFMFSNQDTVYLRAEARLVFDMSWIVTPPNDTNWIALRYTLHKKVMSIQKGIQEGFQKGIQKGIQNGIQNGIQKGIQGIQKGIQGIQKGIQKKIQEGIFFQGNILI